MRFYAHIGNIQDLRSLQTKAKEQGLIAVGFTDSGAAYMYDESRSMSVGLKKQEIQDILALDEIQVDALIESRGKINFDEEVVQTEETLEVHEEVITADEVEVSEEVVIVEETKEEVKEQAPFQENIQHDDSPGEVIEEEKEEVVEEQQEDPRLVELEKENLELKDRVLKYERLFETIKELLVNNII